MRPSKLQACQMAAATTSPPFQQDRLHQARPRLPSIMVWTVAQTMVCRESLSRRLRRHALRRERRGAWLDRSSRGRTGSTIPTFSETAWLSGTTLSPTSLCFGQHAPPSCRRGALPPEWALFACGAAAARVVRSSTLHAWCTTHGLPPPLSRGSGRLQHSMVSGLIAANPF
jgi:hypothetical protein